MNAANPTLDKLNEIAAIMSREYGNVEEYGLLSGQAGIALFFYTMCMMTGKEEYKKEMLACLDNAIDRASAAPFLPTFANGLAGLGCCISFLEKRGLANDYIDDDIDEALLESLKHFLSQNDYDYLHGAIGVALYFHYRHVNTRNSCSREAIGLAAEYLDEVKRIDERGYKWVSHNYHTKEEEYNISLSHGMSSILAFLVRLKSSGEYPQLGEKLDRLISGSASYINAQQIDYAQYGSFFGYMALESLPQIAKSRLAWCYGDLGIATVLKNYGAATGDRTVYDNALNILASDARDRTNLLDNVVMDAGLCHGSSGIALMYNNIYAETGIQTFKTAADYWTGQTLGFSVHKNAYAGYNVYNPNDIGLKESYGLLEGIAGIGLSLAANVYKKPCDWDELMFLK